MEKLNNLFDLGGRVFLSLIFLTSGIQKIEFYEATQGYMSAMGVPEFMLVPTIAFEIIASLLIIIGFKTRIAAFLLSGFSLVTAALFHFDFADQIQSIMFMKNVAMAGGFLMLVVHGAGKWSLDARCANCKK